GTYSGTTVNSRDNQRAILIDFQATGGTNQYGIEMRYQGAQSGLRIITSDPAHPSGNGTGIELHQYGLGAAMCVGQHNPGGAIVVRGDAASWSAFATTVADDTAYRFNIDMNGGLLWGPGGGADQDTSLYRSAAAALATNASLSASALTAT